MIVDVLIQLQKAEGMRNAEFARILGIQEKSWLRIKRRRIIGAETLLTAMRHYPELVDYIITRREKHLNQRRGSLIGKVVVKVIRLIKGE